MLRVEDFMSKFLGMVEKKGKSDLPPAFRGCPTVYFKLFFIVLKIYCYFFYELMERKLVHH